jgi:signal transduction histidine kinase/CheY-like chemotaxis protein
MVINNNFYQQSGEKSRSSDNLSKVLAVLASHGMALWEYDIPTGSCFFPQEYFQILGLDKMGVYFEDIEGSYPFIHPDDLPQYIEFYAQALHLHSEMKSLSYRYIGEHGSVLWAEDHFLSYEKNGRPDGLVIYTANVTEKRQRELQMARLSGRYQKVLDGIPSFIFIFDENFFITDVLKSPKMSLLHSVEELVGVDGRNIYSTEVSELFIKNIHECLRDQSMREIQYPLKMDGQTYYFQARMAPFEDNKVFAMIDDIGERVRRNRDLIEAKRKAEEADRMKNLFLANMSHEIRTPLNAIIGFSEIVPLMDDAEKRDEYLGIIQKNCSLLLQLIDDILDLSRIEAGKEEMHFATVNIAKLVEDVAATQRIKIPKNVKFHVGTPAEELLLYTDPNRLTQIMSNLMSNAIKNTTDGSITLGVDRVGDVAKVFVRDTGCGIPQEKLSIIFNRFEKLDEFKQGTGLGLPICKHLAERLGGRIEVESELGVGSTFSVILHLDDSKAGNLLRKKQRIMVIEPTIEAYEKVKLVLKSDYELIWLTNGAEAIERYISIRPHMVILNMTLPGMGAIEVIERVRKVSTDVPIVALMEYAYYTDQQRAFNAGCNEILTMPYSPERLKDMVKNNLKEV